MALPRVEVSIGITLNVGNYESVRAEARFGQDGVGWDKVVEEAEKGLGAALDGVEIMLKSRKLQKEKTTTAPPLPRTATAVAGPRRAGR